MLREAFAGIDQMIAGLQETERDSAWDEVAEALRALEQGGAFRGPTQFIVGTGVRR